MDELAGLVAVILLPLAIGSCTGYVAAHKEVARECDRLGAFYVGEKTYRCESKK